MSNEPDFISQNAHWYERLSALVGRLGDEDLTRPMQAGWTPASVLGHHRKAHIEEIEKLLEA
jgi:hypothetical protein